MRPSGWPTGGLSSVISPCPFLYQTATILRQQSKPRRVFSTTSISSTPSETHPQGVASEGEELSPEPLDSPKPVSFLKQKAAEIASNTPKLGPSTTPAERAAFENIWNLFGKPSPLPSNDKTRATSIDHTDTNYKNILDLFSPVLQQPNQPAPSSDTWKPFDKSEPPRQLKKFFGRKPTISSTDNFETPNVQPLTRESAVLEIQGLIKDNAIPASTYSSSAEATTTTQTVENVALKLVEDVASSLTKALTSRSPRPDIAMWNVAKEKIFPLIRLLRPSTQPLSLSSSPDQQPTTESTAQIHPLIPPDTPVLPLLSQIYPSLTLLILRLYTTHLPTSPYARALLPTLKSLGPTSYVLGAHTHFYNALLLLYWRVYSDLRGMHGLLTEMETNGVELDMGTWEVLDLVGRDRSADLADEGDRGRAWWGRMEQVAGWPKIGVEWKQIVNQRLREKGLHTGEVMREVHAGKSDNGPGHGGMAGGKDEPEYVAIL